MSENTRTSRECRREQVTERDRRGRGFQAVSVNIRSPVEIIPDSYVDCIISCFIRKKK